MLVVLKSFGINLGKLPGDQFANDVVRDLTTNKECDTKQMHRIFNTKTWEYLKYEDNVYVNVLIDSRKKQGNPEHSDTKIVFMWKLIEVRSQNNASKCGIFHCSAN